METKEKNIVDETTVLNGVLDSNRIKCRYIKDQTQLSRTHLSQSGNLPRADTADGNNGSPLMQDTIGRPNGASNGSHFNYQKEKTKISCSTCNKKVKIGHYCSPVHELGLNDQIPEELHDESNGYQNDYDTYSQTDPSCLDFYATPAQLTTSDHCVPGRLEVWVQKSQTDQDTRIEFVPYRSNSEANGLQDSKPSRESHIFSSNTKHLNRESRRVLHIPKTTTVRNILRFNQNQIPDHLKEIQNPTSLERSSPRSSESTSPVLKTWLDEDFYEPKKLLELQRYSFKQETKDGKHFQRKPRMIDTPTETDKRKISDGWNEYKIILIKNLWRAKYMSDFDTFDPDWKNKINPMHIVIDELDTNRIEEFRRKTDRRK